jgi:hypothetical protein
MTAPFASASSPNTGEREPISARVGKVRGVHELVAVVARRLVFASLPCASARGTGSASAERDGYPQAMLARLMTAQKVTRATFH